MTKGGKRSLAEFLENNHHKLVNFVRTKLDDASHMDSEDIVQDVILNILDRPDITAPISNRTAYIFRALKNRIIDEYRKPDTRTRSLDETNIQELTLYDIIPDLKYEPEDSYRRQLLREQIYAAISDLPPKEQDVIVETEFNKLTFKELSVKQQVPLGTLLARKHRGLKTIQKKLAHIKEEHNVLFNS